ncbi:MAG TPA: ATP synthase F1 subunit epsilon [Longimicrobiales bacterium]|nr:ATP synthase F1 subunit epsilon [Longimicrobiales bacterium]
MAMTVRIVAPDRTVFDGEAVAVVAPAWDGQVGVMSGHAPMITLLGMGALDVDLPTGKGSDRYYIAGGVMKVLDDRVTILTEYAGDELPEHLPEGARIEKEDILESASAGNIFA